MSIGKKNRYTCELCESILVSVDIDDGTTPFMIECWNCDVADMTSEMYMCPQDLIVTHEWYAPDRKERRKLSPSEKNHVEKGGLLMRPLTKRGEHRLRVPLP